MLTEDRLTPEEVGPTEMYKIWQACERFKSYQASLRHAEHYGRMAGDRIALVLFDVKQNNQSRRTCDTATDAYNFARLAHHGWRALRGL